MVEQQVERPGVVRALHKCGPKRLTQRGAVHERNVAQRLGGIDRFRRSRRETSSLQTVGEQYEAVEKVGFGRVHIGGLSLREFLIDVAARIEEARQQRLGELRQRHSVRLGANVHGGDHAAGPVAQRRGNRPHTHLELLIE